MKRAVLDSSGHRKATYLLILFLVAALLLFLNANTSLYINNILVHFVIFVLAVALFPILIAYHFFGLCDRKTVLIILFSALCVSFLTAFLTWNGDWKTQTVLYRNLKNPTVTIEYQMRGDRFSFGYKERIVQREKMLPFLDWITAADTTKKIDPSQWRRVDLDVNEMKIPGEYVNAP